MCKTEFKEPQRVVNMRAREAAQYLGVGLSTVWLYAKQGKLTPIKLSDRVTIFKKEDLDNFINANGGVVIWKKNLLTS